MEDPEWEARRAVLINSIKQMPPTHTMLGNGEDLQIETASLAEANLVHHVTQEAFREFRGVLNPPNGSDIETVDDVGQQMISGGALIGLVSGSAAAALRITINPGHLYIGRVGVVPQHRRKGIGAAMIATAEQIAIKLLLPEVRLGTREKLPDNVAFYIRLGYTVDRVVPHPRGQDNVVLFVKQVAPGGR
jgi:phosphinothricin acetyltransferase